MFNNFFCNWQYLKDVFKKRKTSEDWSNQWRERKYGSSRSQGQAFWEPGKPDISPSVTWCRKTDVLSLQCCQYSHRWPAWDGHAWWGRQRGVPALCSRPRACASLGSWASASHSITHCIPLHRSPSWPRGGVAHPQSLVPQPYLCIICIFTIYIYLKYFNI